MGRSCSASRRHRGPVRSPANPADVLREPHPDGHELHDAVLCLWVLRLLLPAHVVRTAGAGVTQRSGAVCDPPFGSAIACSGPASARRSCRQVGVSEAVRGRVLHVRGGAGADQQHHDRLALRDRHHAGDDRARVWLGSELPTIGNASLHDVTGQDSSLASGVQVNLPAGRWSARAVRRHHDRLPARGASADQRRHCGLGRHDSRLRPRIQGGGGTDGGRGSAGARVHGEECVVDAAGSRWQRSIPVQRSRNRLTGMMEVVQANHRLAGPPGESFDRLRRNPEELGVRCNCRKPSRAPS